MDSYAFSAPKVAGLERSQYMSQRSETPWPSGTDLVIFGVDAS